MAFGVLQCNVIEWFKLRVVIVPMVLGKTAISQFSTIVRLNLLCKIIHIQNKLQKHLQTFKRNGVLKKGLVHDNVTVNSAFVMQLNLVQ